MSGKMCGGMKETEAATAEVQGLIDKVQAEAEKAAGRSFEKYEAKIFATQLVNGVNYFVKVDTGSSFLHIRLHKSFQGAVTFSSIQDGKAEADDLAYF
ncbi:cystatin-A2-like [Anneissia japonica]|uniref:cystatin-A2-like n=1 Tax=Anneissia japonica TaxID=1529436 RepID=UPI0014255A94|nr:cystatin-A2-like [Anneissia japonica]